MDSVALYVTAKTELFPATLWMPTIPPSTPICNLQQASEKYLCKWLAIQLCSSYPLNIKILNL